MPTAYRIASRYVVCEPMASGGMGSIHIGRLLGPAGFTRTVAIKKPHKHLADDPNALAMFIDEARLVTRIRHVNVVPTLEVVEEGDDLYIVMEYVPGVSLASLLRATKDRGMRMPLPVAAQIASGMLRGLHAAHEAKSEDGQPLGIVHRDVSPGNVLVGTDGIARVVDFGVAKAQNRLSVTPGDSLKGKLAYMSPEQLVQRAVSARSDVFSAGVVLWECLTTERLFAGANDAMTLNKLVELAVPKPSAVAGPEVAPLDAVVQRALYREPGDRHATALEMAVAIERAVPPASSDEVGRWVQAAVPDLIAQKAALVERVERSSVPPDRTTDPIAPEKEVSTTHSMTQAFSVRPPARRRSAFVVGSIGASLLVGGALVAWRLTLGHGASMASASAPDAAPPSEIGSTPGVASPSQVASVELPPGSVSVLIPAAVSKPRPATSAHVPAAPPANCDPPFVWEDGVKKFRTECFRGKPGR